MICSRPVLNMMKGISSIKYGIFLFLTLAAASVCNAQKLAIGLIKDHCDTKEIQAIRQLFKEDSILDIRICSLADLDSKSLAKFKGLWYHRTDSLPFTAAELKAGCAVKEFVAKGGALFLSMEAFPLLNAWGIEPQKPGLQSDFVVDEGFGRPLGFHAFKDHPVFEGLLGGVYTSKQKENHYVRKHGFFDSSLPEVGRVIGIQWTYIRFWENNKLLLEYTAGKGKIIAAGAYLYFDVLNYQQQHLKKFIQNVFLYMVKRSDHTPKYYWSYNHGTPREQPFKTAEMHPVPAKKWLLPQPTLQLKQPVATNDFFDLVGRRILWMGKINSGVEEIWVHPFMALRDFEAGVRIRGRDSVTWLRNRKSRATIAPEFLIREYDIQGTVLREVHTVSFEKPLGIVHFEIEGDLVQEIVVRYISNLRYMWPYNSDASGTITYQYSRPLNGHIISAQDGGLNTVVRYSQLPTYQSVKENEANKGVEVLAGFDTRKTRYLDFCISGSTSSYTEAIQQLPRKASGPDSLLINAGRYYSNLFGSHLVIETPDSNFNEGYKWALARTDQFLQTTPGIGTSLMAGFGTTARGWNGRHSISGRPGYAWYFGRDAVWSAMAINAYGGFDMVKEILRSFARYQDINGKIYHELTSSGVAHYDAADATPLFVILAGHYLRYSGDVNFIKELWPSVKKAIAYCKSTDTDADGLIENTNVGHGWIEGGPLFGTHTEFYLAGCWAATLDAASYMCKSLGNSTEAKAYEIESATVKQIIDRDFWNPAAGFFHNGKMRNGSYMPDATVLAAVPVYLNAVTDSNKIVQVNSRFSSKYFSSDWGLRMIEDSSKKYNPGSYHSGMVWPLYSGWAALSEFRSGHNASGYKHIMNNLMIYRDWAPGSLEETLNGNVYEPNGVCHHQCWSETMVLQPAIEGMLGLDADAVKNWLQLSPYFPWHWNNAQVKHIKVGNKLVDMSMKRMENTTTYSIHCSSGIAVAFGPRFPLATQIDEVRINGLPVDFTVEQQPEGIKLSVSATLKSGDNAVVIKHQGGVGYITDIATPRPGSLSKGLQLISEKAGVNKYEMVVQGLADTTYQVRIFSAKKPASVSGATFIIQNDKLVIIEVNMPAVAPEKYATKKIEISF